MQTDNIRDLIMSLQSLVMTVTNAQVSTTYYAVEYLVPPGGPHGKDNLT